MIHKGLFKKVSVSVNSVREKILTILLILILTLTLTISASAEWGDIIMDSTLSSMQKANQKPVLFLHWFHRIRYKCKTCHEGLFKSEKGTNGITMETIAKGNFCGKCHNGIIAFSANECERCHNYDEKMVIKDRLIPTADRKDAEEYEATRLKILRKTGPLAGTTHDGKGFITRSIMENEPMEKMAFMSLEKDKYGMVNWVKAVKNGKIAPVADIGDEKIEDIIDEGMRIFQVKSESVNNVLFSHDIHTYWLGCNTCHDGLFPKDMRSVEMKMADFIKGKWCGKCHRKVSFSLGDCKRCHFIPKDIIDIDIIKSGGLEKEMSNEEVREFYKQLLLRDEEVREKEKIGHKKDRSQKIQDALTRARKNEESQHKAKEEWLSKFNEQSSVLKEIASPPDIKQYPTAPAGMVFIPGGHFLRGLDWGKTEDSQPSKIIEVSPFFIDQLEVTVEEYIKYLKSINKPIPPFLSDLDMGGDKQPVFKAKWQEAVDYCASHGKRLPTEAEWEKAARGWDNRYFPWGNELPDENGEYRANYNPGMRFEDGFRYTSDVGTFIENGASPYGVLDMAGNLWEWTSDWYDPNYYKGSDRKDPKGPESGDEKVIRGGGYDTFINSLILTTRLSEKPEMRRFYIGFRCAMSQ